MITVQKILDAVKTFQPNQLQKIEEFQSSKEKDFSIIGVLAGTVAISQPYLDELSRTHEYVDPVPHIKGSIAVKIFKSRDPNWPDAFSQCPTTVILYSNKPLKSLYSIKLLNAVQVVISSANRMDSILLVGANMEQLAEAGVKWTTDLCKLYGITGAVATQSFPANLDCKKYEDVAVLQKFVEAGGVLPENIWLKYVGQAPSELAILIAKHTKGVGYSGITENVMDKVMFNPRSAGTFLMYNTSEAWHPGAYTMSKDQFDRIFALAPASVGRYCGYNDGERYGKYFTAEHFEKIFQANPQDYLQHALFYQNSKATGSQTKSLNFPITDTMLSYLVKASPIAALKLLLAEENLVGLGIQEKIINQLSKESNIDPMKYWEDDGRLTPYLKLSPMYSSSNNRNLNILKNFFPAIYITGILEKHLLQDDVWIIEKVLQKEDLREVLWEVIRNLTSHKYRKKITKQMLPLDVIAEQFPQEALTLQEMSRWYEKSLIEFSKSSEKLLNKHRFTDKNLKQSVFDRLGLKPENRVAMEVAIDHELANNYAYHPENEDEDEFRDAVNHLSGIILERIGKTR